MTDRIVSDGCALCCVLHAQRLAAIVAGDCEALARARALIYRHRKEHIQALFERAFAQVQEMRQDETIATTTRRR
jgi:hypothetical protein